MGANKSLKMKDIHAMSDVDLAKKISVSKDELVKSSFHHGVATLENPLSLRAKRRDIARLLTAKRARKA